MGILSYFNVTVTVLRPQMVERRGSRVPDWTNPTEITVTDCHAQPIDASYESEGRESNQTSRARLYAPVDADIRRGDRVLALGETFEVVESLPYWPSPTGRLAHRQFDLERWEG